MPNNSHFREGREFEAPREIQLGKNAAKPVRALRTQPEVQVERQDIKRVTVDDSGRTGTATIKKPLGDSGFLHHRRMTKDGCG